MTPQSQANDGGPNPPDAPPDKRRRRLLFRACHRGTHENDLMIGGFVAPRLHLFTDSEIDALEAILEFEDVALADWLTGREPIPAQFDSPMLRAIRAAAIGEPSS